MPKIVVRPRELHQPAIPKGVYRAILREITEAEVPATVEANDFRAPGDLEWNWMFQIDDPGHPEVSGRTLFQRTNTAEGKGEQFLRFLRGFGYDEPRLEEMASAGEGIDSEKLTNTVVKIDVTARTTDDGRTFNGVKSVVLSS